ncbi:MAG: Rieske 2Fe-2S domain-containing protein [Acidimicrobiia bacterium]|nr:Rieske 2Fe-2S domain-containing protein [Acidimicrobiia bacterium]
MLTADDNEMLTRTGRGTPMGELFRRFWTPVLLSEELAGADGDPVRVRVMGEDLVAFRDSVGRVGVVDPRCSHRGADLFLGRNEECGLRCVYHGWKFDVAGACVDAPTVGPPEETVRFREGSAITAYPAEERGGIVWAYLGPPEQRPPLPDLELFEVAESHRFASKKLQEANWAQLCEGGLDTAHFSFVHMPVDVDALDIGTGAGGAGQQHTRWMKNDPRPRFSVKAHPGGLAMGGARRADPGQAYWRVAQFLLPNHGLAPSAMKGRTYTGQTWVPIDDETTWVFCYSWNPDRPLEANERGYVAGVPSIYSEVDERYVPVRNRANGYLLDRDVQRRLTYSGIEGVSEQDAAVQESQGTIADRTRERLGPTDLGIVRFRKLVLDMAKALTDGVEPEVAMTPEAFRVRSGAIVVDEALDFDDVLLARFGTPNGEVETPPATGAAEAPVATERADVVAG